MAETALKNTKSIVQNPPLTTGHSAESTTTLDISGQVGQEAKPETAPAPSNPVPSPNGGIVLAPELDTDCVPSAPRESEKQQRQRLQDATKAEQDLIEMIIVLRRFLGNAATSSNWQIHMQTHGKAGWSKSAFDRRLRIVKARKWIKIVGDPEAIMDKVRVPEGSLFEATELAPGTPTPSVSNQCHDRDVGKAAKEQLERLKRGKLPAA